MSRKLTFLFAAVLSIIDPTAALPAGATPANQAAIDGEAFDRAFVERMIQEHEEAIDLLHAPAGDAEVNHVARNGRT